MWSHVNETVSYPAESAVPNKNMAALPSALLTLFHGSLFLPYLRPMMSANPSPPHIMETAQMPGTVTCHVRAVTNTSTTQYTNGPLRSSLRSPLRLTVVTGLMSRTPVPVRNRAKPAVNGTNAAKNAEKLVALQQSSPMNQILKWQSLFQTWTVQHAHATGT